MERPQPSGEGLRLRQKLQVSVEVQLAILKSLFECVDELAAKEFTQHFLGQEIVVAGTNPAGVIGRETAGRHDTVHMGMSGELLTPRMQDTEEADLCAEVSGIASDFEEGFGTGAEQEIVEDFLVLQHHRSQATRQGEDHMEIARGEKLLLTRRNPAVPSGGLTLRAMAIATAVIRDGDTMSAAHALIEMTAECGRTTTPNGAQDFDVLPTEPLAVSFDERLSCSADDVGPLHTRPGHF